MAVLELKNICTRGEDGWKAMLCDEGKCSMYGGGYTRDLGCIGGDDLGLVGGKGAGLGELVRAGIPVPQGFAVTTGAYSDFVGANGLDEVIEDSMAGVPEGDPGRIADAARRIAEAFASATVPNSVHEDVLSAYRALGCPPVAVRSSATAEDLPGTSFAGQYETYLNIAGDEELMDSIKACWASLWNERALSYRARFGIDDERLAHAVVVQEMVDADRAGILFTANPVDGRRDRSLLNASWGLGEAIVSGSVTPDQWILDNAEGTIVEEIIADKEVMTAKADGDVRDVHVDEGKRTLPSLDAKYVHRLHSLGQRIEEHFGSPQDIEWAERDGEIFLVQSRPITSLFPSPCRAEGVEGLRALINFGVLSQGMQEPLTPMGEAFFLQTFVNPARRFDASIENADDLWWCQVLAGRVFLDMTDLLREEKKWDKVLENDLFAEQEPMTARALRQFLEANRDAITGERSRVTPWILRNLAPFARMAFPMAKNVLYGRVFPDRARERALAQWSSFPVAMKEDLQAAGDRRDRLDAMLWHVGEFMLSGWETLCLLAASFGKLKRARGIAKRYLDDLSDFDYVGQSLPHNTTTEMGVALMEMARDYDRRGETPGIDDPGIADFLQHYGNRSIQEVDVGVPNWWEEPEYVRDLVQSYIDNGSYEQGLDAFHEGALEADRAIERIREGLRIAGAGRRADRVAGLLREYRSVFGLREESKFVMTRMYDEARRALWAMGEELVSEGSLQSAGDIFFLRPPDIVAGGDLRSVAEENRVEYERHWNMNAPRVLASTGESIYAPAEEGEGILPGVPVSPGVHEGRARVLGSPREGASLQPGDILVTRATNPAWTPLFVSLGGIVMETGGPISHGAVVAREYGIPAVVGVGEATKRIRDGQRIQVDGGSGRVRLLD